MTTSKKTDHGNAGPAPSPQKSGGALRRGLLTGLFLAAVTGCGADAPKGSMNYSTFREAVNENKVQSVTQAGNALVIDGQSFSEIRKGANSPVVIVPNGVELCNPAAGGVDCSKFSFRATVPEKGVDPLTIIFGLSLAFMVFSYARNRKLAGGGPSASGGGASGALGGFGKSKAKMLEKNAGPVTFADVAGIDECRDEAAEIIDYLRDPKKFQKMDAKAPKGTLLVGPPGTGKTLLARAIAGEAGVPFFSISGSEFEEVFVGVGASRVRDLFAEGKKKAPCVIFIDEIDAVGRHRGSSMTGAGDQTLNQLLTEMDGFEASQGIIILAATNRPDVLDPALTRPGRFDRRVTVPKPDLKGREAILKIHTRKKPLADDVDLTDVARKMTGAVGADLGNLANEAALRAVRYGRDKITAEDFDQSRDKVMMGPERKGALIPERTKRMVAAHEAGHTVAMTYIPGSTPAEKVSIIPRGNMGGVTVSSQDEEGSHTTRRQLIARIAVFAAGRAGELLNAGGDREEISPGASDDIKQMTRIINAMVKDLALGDDSLGMLAYGSNDEDRMRGIPPVESQDDAALISAARKTLAKEGWELALKTLETHKTEWQRLTEALIVHETLNATEITKVMAGEEINPVRPAPPPPFAPAPKKAPPPLPGAGPFGGTRFPAG